MGHEAFDRLAATFSALTSRRKTLGRLGAAGLVAVLSGRGTQAEAKKKKKKKCKKPKVKCGKKCCPAGQVCSSGKCAALEQCNILKAGTLWTLQANCTITKSIEIPDGVTFDGNNKTITMTGDVSGFTKAVPDNWTVAAGVLANGSNANVRNLTIRGSNLSGNCSPAAPEGVAFINTTGEIENVTAEDIRLDAATPCGVGISATGTGGQSVEILDATVSGSPLGILGLSRAETSGVTVEITRADVSDAAESGVTFRRPVTGTLSDSTVEGTATSVTVETGAEASIQDNALSCASEGTAVSVTGFSGGSSSATIERNTITGGRFGILASDQGVIVVQDSNTVTGAVIGIGAEGEGSSAQVTGNTVVGPGPIDSDLPVAGVGFIASATGSVSGNTISNYFDDGTGEIGCGILVDATAGAVTIGSNTFPDPSGNEQNVCDFS